MSLKISSVDSFILARHNVHNQSGRGSRWIQSVWIRAISVWMVFCLLSPSRFYVPRIVTDFLKILATWAWFVFIYSIVIEESLSPGTYSNYLTHWTLFVSWVYASLLFIATAKYYHDQNKRMQAVNATKDKQSKQSKKTEEGVVWWLQLCWLFQNLALTSGTIVVAVFWWFEVIPKGDVVVDVFNHGALWGTLVLDFWFLGRQPFLFLHFFWSMLYFWVYGFGTLVYFWSQPNMPNPGYIYPEIRWDTNPSFTGLVWFVYSIGGVFVVQGMFWIVDLTRDSAFYVQEESHSFFPNFDRFMIREHLKNQYAKIGN